MALETVLDECGRDDRGRGTGRSFVGEHWAELRVFVCTDVVLVIVLVEGYEYTWAELGLTIGEADLLDGDL